MIAMLLFLDNLGGGELLVIMVFVLFFFGSKKVPDLARGLGRASREFKDAMNGVQREIENSVNTDVKKPDQKSEISSEIPKIEGSEDKKD
jgi:sec-independent protein translocase protein TatA